MGDTTSIEWTDATSGCGLELLAGVRAAWRRQLVVVVRNPVDRHVVDRAAGGREPFPDVSVALRAVAREAGTDDVARLAEASSHERHHVVDRGGRRRTVGAWPVKQLGIDELRNRLEAPLPCLHDGTHAKAEVRVPRVELSALLVDVLPAQAAVDGFGRMPRRAFTAPVEASCALLGALALRWALPRPFAPARTASRCQPIVPRPVGAEVRSRLPRPASPAPFLPGLDAGLISRRRQTRLRRRDLQCARSRLCHAAQVTSDLRVRQFPEAA